MMKTEIRDQRQSKWYWIDRTLVRRDAKILGVNAIAVYNVLASYAAKDTQTSYPGIRKIANMLGISATTVRESLEALEINKWISIEKRYDEEKKRHLSHVYTLLDAPATAAALLPQRRQGGTAANTDQYAVILSSDNGSNKNGKKPRKPNPWFDAVAVVSKLDPKTAGSDIGKHATIIQKADYPPDAIYRFESIWYTRDYPGGKTDRKPPSPGSIAKYIGWTRQPDPLEESIVPSLDDNPFEVVAK